jgi:hypothetical protein
MIGLPAITTKFKNTPSGSDFQLHNALNFKQLQKISADVSYFYAAHTQ